MRSSDIVCGFGVSRAKCNARDVIDSIKPDREGEMTSHRPGCLSCVIQSNNQRNREQPVYLSSVVVSYLWQWKSHSPPENTRTHTMSSKGWIPLSLIWNWMERSRLYQKHIMIVMRVSMKKKLFAVLRWRINPTSVTSENTMYLSVPKASLTRYSTLSKGRVLHSVYTFAAFLSTFLRGRNMCVSVFILSLLFIGYSKCVCLCREIIK